MQVTLPESWSAETCFRFPQATCRRRTAVGDRYPEPLDAALLCRQVGKAPKAVTSHRSPNELYAINTVSPTPDANHKKCTAVRGRLSELERGGHRESHRHLQRRPLHQPEQAAGL